VLAGENLTAAARPEKTFLFGVMSSTKTPLGEWTALLMPAVFCFIAFSEINIGEAIKGGYASFRKSCAFFRSTISPR